MKKKELARGIMYHLVTCAAHGYSQLARNGNGTETINYCGVEVNIKSGDRDCSSAVIDAFESAGISCGGATYTGNMRQRMCATGNFRWHPRGDGYKAKGADVYLNEVHHTAMCLSDSPNLLMQFSISENGTISGAQGDQTGKESVAKAYYDYPWDGILECINSDDVPGTEDKPQMINATIQSNTGADCMRLTLEEVSDGVYKIKDKANGFCLTASAGTADANVDFRGFDCGDYQKWRLLEKKYKNATYMMLESVAAPGLYLSVEKNGIGNNNLKLYTDLHNQKQKFYIREESDGTTLLIHVYTGKCVAAKE